MSRYLRWLLPGLGLKRWLLLSVAGIFLLGLAISLVVRINLYGIIGAWLFEHISYSAAMVFRGPMIAGLLGLVAGAAMTLYGLFRVVQSMVRTLVGSPGVAEAYYQRRYLLRGPKVVAIGGGTGIPTLLRGLKQYTGNITAIVTVADDGGSSGRLRTEFGILPPGDIRNCLVALADTEPLLERLFQYRFHQGSGLAGHPFGNLFILAMTETAGNFYDAVRACSQVLAIRGRVMPSTLDQVTLKAQLADGAMVVGESNIGHADRPIRRIFLERVDGADPRTEVEALPDALAAIAEADLIVLGPGSLYTSIIPNLLVPGITDAIRRSRALKIYACNIMTEPGETDSHTASRHVQALIDHAGYGLIDLALVNNELIPSKLLKRYRERHAAPVPIDSREVQKTGVGLVQANLLLKDQEYARHDPDKLARMVLQLFLKHRTYTEHTPWEFLLLRQRLQQREKEEASGS